MNKRDKQRRPRQAWLNADELKASTRIEDVLESYGLLPSLTARGTALLGPSPFHEGDEPTFRVDPGRGLWQDFQGRPEGCKGNVIGLVQALESCTFRQALEILAERFAHQSRDAVTNSLRGSDNPSGLGPGSDQGGESGPRAAQAPRARPRPSPGPPSPSPHPPGPQAPEAGGHDEEPEAPLFGKELRGLRFDVPLLAERGISEKTAKAYGVGYCSRGLMKSRLAAPVHSLEGEVAGYVGRSLKPGPRTELWKNPAGFHRSHYLFGLHRLLETGGGRKAAKDYGLLVVQSPLDVLRLAEANYHNAVALMAASASRQQLALLLEPKINPTRRITLLLDNDAAGEAVKREMASTLIRTGFIRYACWEVLETDETSPDRLSDAQLRQALSLGTAAA